VQINIGIPNQRIYSLLVNYLWSMDYNVVQTKQKDQKIHLWILEQLHQDLTPCFIVIIDNDRNKVIKAIKSGAEDSSNIEDIEEIVVRINKLISRLYSDQECFIIDDYQVDLLEKKIFDNGELISLTNNEFMIIEYLLKNRNTAIKREMILDAIWGKDYYGSIRVVDDTIRRIRKKLPRLNVRMIYGFGYRLDS